VQKKCILEGAPGHTGSFFGRRGECGTVKARAEGIVKVIKIIL